MSSTDGLLSRLRHADDGPLALAREILSSVAFVAILGLVLFGVSGVWPPMVAVESGSMQPHMVRGDLVFVTAPGRLTPDSALGDTGVVTADGVEQSGYQSFGAAGSVVVYETPSHPAPIIHRARFWVDEGENWYDKADSRYMEADSCRELLNCPAPNSGFITKGDNNTYYDQAMGLSSPVSPERVVGLARARIPALGCLRLGLGEYSCLA